MTEYVAKRTTPNGITTLEIINDSPIDVAVRNSEIKRGYTYEILEKLHPNWGSEALAKYFK